MSDEFQENGGLCWICDANHSQTRHPVDGHEICYECLRKIKERMLHEQRN